MYLFLLKKDYIMVKNLAIEHFCSELFIKRKAALLCQHSLCQTEQFNLKVLSTSAVKPFSF